MLHSAWDVGKGCYLDLSLRGRKCVQYRARDQCKIWEQEGLIPDDWKDEPGGPWHAYYLED